MVHLLLHWSPLPPPAAPLPILQRSHFSSPYWSSLPLARHSGLTAGQLLTPRTESLLLICLLESGGSPPTKLKLWAVLWGARQPPGVSPLSLSLQVATVMAAAKGRETPSPHNSSPFHPCQNSLSGKDLELLWTKAEQLVLSLALYGRGTRRWGAVDRIHCIASEP